MGSTSKLALALVLVGIVAGALWFGLERGEPAARPAELSVPNAAEESSVALPTSTEVPARAVLDEAADPAASAGEGSVAPAPTVPAAAVPTCVVRARFVDVVGTPWEGVRFFPAGEGGPASTSGGDGRAELVLAVPAAGRDPAVQIVAARAGCATRTMRTTLAPGITRDLGLVVLDREARVHGLVRDEQGVGLEGVTVGLSPLDYDVPDPGRLRRQGSHAFDTLIVARSDARGAFDLAGVPAGAWRLWGRRDDRGYGVSEPFEVLPGEEELGVDFVVLALLATDSLSGRVLDPSGAAIGGANVLLAYEVENESGTMGATTQPDGTFRFLLYLETDSDLVASDPQGRFAEAAVRGVPPGSRDVVLQLVDPSTQPRTRVQVSGPANEPVREVELQSRAGRANSYSESRLASVELAPGVHEFQVPAASFGVTVAAPGYIPSALVPLDPASLPSEIPVRLQAAPALAGIVRAKGAPVAGAVVAAQRAVNHRLSINGFPCRMSTSADARATAGADGAFRLVLRGKEDVYLRCTAPGHAPTIVGPIRVDAPPASIEIELGPGGALEGRVRAKDGTTVVGAIVGITNGDGHPRTLRSGHDGMFRFEGLAEGAWLVLERDEEFRTDLTMLRSEDKEEAIPWSCDVVAGRTTEHDLVLDR